MRIFAASKLRRMAKKNTEKKTKSEEPVAVAQALGKTEEFLAKYKKHLLYSAIAIVVILGGGFAYMKLIREPRKQEALAQLFPAESYFRADSFNLALNGDGNNMGFKDIIDEYKALPGKVVYFYAGVSELQMGNYQEAINYLKKYNAKDEIIQARAYCNIGDAYVGTGDLQNGLSYYLKAAEYKDNAYSAAYYKKAGIIYEELDNKVKALEMYKLIKDKYPQSIEGYDIDKYISRLEVSE